MKLFPALIVVSLMVVMPLSGLAADSLDQELTSYQHNRDLDAIRERLAAADPEVLATVTGRRWQAWLAQVDEDFERAVELLDQALEQAPNDARLVLFRASLRMLEFNGAGMMASMRIARAMRNDFERAVELDPDLVAARTALIQYHLMAPRVAGGSSRRASEHMELLRQQSPERHLDLLAVKAATEDDIERSADYLAQALEIDDDADRRLNYGLALQQLERWDQARRQFDAIVESNPRHAAAWYQLGRTAVLEEAGLDQGLLAFERFLALPRWPGDPTLAAAWWRIGQIHELREDQAAARLAYQRALQEDDQFEEARQALEELEKLG